MSDQPPTEEDLRRELHALLMTELIGSRVPAGPAGLYHVAGVVRAWLAKKQDRAELPPDLPTFVVRRDPRHPPVILVTPRPAFPGGPLAGVVLVEDDR